MMQMDEIHPFVHPKYNINMKYSDQLKWVHPWSHH